MKTWTLAKKPPASFLRKFPELPDIVARLLYHRGIKTQKAIDEFLNPDYGDDTHDPFLFKDMRKAVDRLFKAIDAKEHIVVHGDYDADGVSAAAILVEALRALGARVDVFIPHRETEGYGLNMNTVDLLHHDGTTVIITCDCGVSNVEEVVKAQAYGMDVIITDHHTTPEILPPAFAIIHPKVPGEAYPFHDLSGGGVAWKFATALVRSRAVESIPDVESFLKWQLDCVAISTVADMVPLLGENRTLVKYGLVVLDRTRRPGLRALLDRSGGKRAVDATMIGFTIAPRLNAAGRMNHANAAYALLTATDTADGEALAATLEQSNKDRQSATAEMVKTARTHAQQTMGDDDKVVVVWNDQWSPSLTGLVASRLVNEHHCPAFVLTQRDAAWVGSGRSIPGFHLINELRGLDPSPFEKVGGHPGAAGFTLKAGVTPEQFADIMRAATLKTLGTDALVDAITVDAEVRLADITWETFDVLQQFTPFGVGNPEPTYCARGLMVVERAEMGSVGQHLKLIVQEEGNEKKWKALAFSRAKEFADIHLGDTIDLAFAVAVDTWNGNRELMLTITDLKKTS